MSAKCGSVHDRGAAGHEDKVCGYSGHTRSGGSCPFHVDTVKQALKAETKAAGPVSDRGLPVKPKIAVVKMAWLQFVKDRRLIPAVESFVKVRFWGA